MRAVQSANVKDFESVRWGEGGGVHRRGRRGRRRQGQLLGLPLTLKAPSQSVKSEVHGRSERTTAFCSFEGGGTSTIVSCAVNEAK
jgi:hypothetical protein